MRKLFDQLTRTLRNFREQRDNLLLLVPCADSDVAFLLKALRDLDRQAPADLYLLFADDFLAPDVYMTTLASRLQEELALTNEATGQSDEKLPPLPTEILDQRSPAPERLKAGLRYARSLVDPRKGQRVIWGMGPMSIKDPTKYLELLAQLPPKPDILPWMRGARVVARVPADFNLERSPLAQAKRVNVDPFVIPPNANEEGLLADAADPKMPVGERMQAEVQLAYLDYAHGRFDTATERFRKALAFFQWAQIPAMEGLIISGLGDIARRRGDWKKAQHWYACAVLPASESGSPILLSTVVQNLAVVAYQEERWADAEERYDELVTIKRGMFDEVGLVEALEWRGNSQEKQEAFDRAVLSWAEAALVCKDFELKDRLAPLLANWRRGYERLGMREDLKTFDAEWSD
jgi:tetratricopeptide (TPR) repeat protein